jgi:hypothetical protein
LSNKRPEKLKKQKSEHKLMISQELKVPLSELKRRKRQQKRKRRMSQVALELFLLWVDYLILVRQEEEVASL